MQEKNEVLQLFLRDSTFDGEIMQNIDESNH